MSVEKQIRTDIADRLRREGYAFFVRGRHLEDGLGMKQPDVVETHYAIALCWASAIVSGNEDALLEAGEHPTDVAMLDRNRGIPFQGQLKVPTDDVTPLEDM